MAVSRDTAKSILAKTATEFALTGPAMAFFAGWGEKWLGPWARDAEYTARAVTTMSRNAAAHAKSFERRAA